MQSSHSIAILANGVIQDYNIIAPLIEKYDRIIAADGGLLHCQAMGIVPDLIIGDLDSTPEEVLNAYPDIPVKRFPIEKDFTDLELAIEAAEPDKCSKITLFGASGDRLDCTLAHFYLLARFAGKIQMETETEVAFAVDAQQEIQWPAQRRVSLLPIGPSTPRVFSQGLKWELTGKPMNARFFSISNETLEDAFTLKVDQGIVICVLSKS